MATKLPYEIWSLISVTACHRDQSTLFSLLRTSKYLKVVVEGNLPDIISVRGLQQLVSFAKYVECHRPWAVRHLHLSTESTEAAKPWYERLWASVSHQDAQKAMRKILSAVSFTLQSLCVCYMATTSFFPEGCNFPVLKDLIVVCKSFEIIKLPALERLHFVSKEDIREHKLTMRMAECTPNLLEMRTSNHSMHSTEVEMLFMQCLHLGRLVIRKPPNYYQARESGSMCRYCTQLTCIGEYCRGFSYNVAGDVMKQVYVITTSVSGPSKLGSRMYDGLDARRDWLDALDGGSGSWGKDSDQWPTEV